MCGEGAQRHVTYPSLGRRVLSQNPGILASSGSDTLGSGTGMWLSEVERVGLTDSGVHCAVNACHLIHTSHLNATPTVVLSRRKHLGKLLQAKLTRIFV